MWAAAEGVPSREDMRAALEARHGAAWQRRASGATVAVCGLGGLGSHIAGALARAGIGTLRLIDFDRVDVTNLHRQQYKAAQVGRYKTEALQENLREIAPYVALDARTARITAENLPELLQGADIVCEALDGAEDKAMLADGVLAHFPRTYLIAASGMAGLGSANGIRTRKITDHFYLCGDGVSDAAELGSLYASRVMLCAAHQAHMVLRILAGELDA